MKFKFALLTFIIISLVACGSDSNEVENTADSLASSEIAKAKEEALKICTTQANQMPAEVQAQVKEICECSIEKTDFEELAKLTEAGDTEAVATMTMEAAKSCAPS